MEFIDPHKEETERTRVRTPLEHAVLRTSAQVEAAKAILAGSGYEARDTLVVAMVHVLAVNQAAVEALPR